MFITEKTDGVRYLVVEDLIRLNRILIELQTPAEPAGVLHMNLLESSQQAPAVFAYYEQTRDVFALASRLIESLAQNHAFHNANKRTAFAAGAMFLLLNGYELTGPGHEAVTLTHGLVVGEYTRVEVEDWLCYWSRHFDATRLNEPNEDEPMSRLFARYFPED